MIRKRKVKLKIESREDGYWVMALPDSVDCGPYKNFGEAKEARAGLERFYNEELLGYDREDEDVDLDA